ncbi:MAG: hypothetical protein RLZZ241_2426 [Bacteroidota bacterium]|jgi:glycosyltransferase involved in cell wall biosynthesis
MSLYFSIVVPVYNRPEELRELLASLVQQEYTNAYELVVVEDGSVHDAKQVVQQFSDRIQITYLPKPNSGPGDSRNYGMQHAAGNYFILVDSDCILPSNYLSKIHLALESDFAHCFGGRDAAHPSFNAMQKAISYSMTSALTTGGLRGASKPMKNFQPRSFNMGLSKIAFEQSKGFGNIHPGEDPDLSLRLKAKGFSIRYLPEVIVYHKRRITFKLFYRQVRRFGLTRPILNRWHPGSARLTYWFPLVFSLGLLLGVGLFIVTNQWQFHLIAYLYLIYFVSLVAGAGLTYRSLNVAYLVPIATLVQFWGYGFGFLKSTTLLTFSKSDPETLMPELFFKR